MHAPAPQQRPACAAHGGRKYPVSRHHVSVLCAGSQWHYVRVGGVRGGQRRARGGVRPRAATAGGTGNGLSDFRCTQWG